MIYTQPATITYSDESTGLQTFTLTAAALNAIEADRLKQVALVGIANVPTSVLGVIQRDLNERTVIPALTGNMPPALADAYNTYRAAFAIVIGDNVILPG